MMKRFVSLVLAVLSGVSMQVLAQGILQLGGPEKPYETGETDIKRWKEESLKLPDFPENAYLQEFFVSGAARNVFMVDTRALTFGDDHVARFVLVIETPSGVRNVFYEGIRCDTGFYKIYATGGAGGNWQLTHSDDWRDIQYAGVNRYHGALWKEYLCEGGFPLPKDKVISLMKEGVRH